MITSPVSAKTLVIANDRGGSIDAYNQRYQQLKADHVQVVFDGACVSACTRFMTLPDACATPRGAFWFHGVQSNGRLNIELGKEDSWRWDNPRAWTLENVYNTFAMGYVSSRPAPVIALQHGMDRVFVPIRTEDGSPLFQEFLRVQAALLVPPC